MASSPGTLDGDIGFQVAPMVDVVFVLLLFFMASAGWPMKERELQTFLPAPGKGAPTAVTLDITQDGRVMLNDEAFGEADDRQLAKLRAWLKATRERFGTDDSVIIRPAATTRHERLMDVLNATGAAGVRTVSFF